MEERIKQWVNKKIQEYIGEEELTLVDFICGKVKNQCNPETLLNDVKMVSLLIFSQYIVAVS